MKLFLLITLIVLQLVTFSGCETSSNNTASQSAIPWNRPASWEGGGALGAMGVGSH